MSDAESLFIGSPKCSILNSVFSFSIYINDTKRCCEFLNCVQHGDNTTLYVSGDNLNAMFNTMNAPLEKTDLWLRLGKLSLNIYKNHYINSTNSLRNRHLAKFETIFCRK